MNAKKYAVRGLIAVAVVVAVCMFFASTIRTIATAKVKIITPKQGKLTQSVELSGKLYFPESDDVFIEGAGDATISVTSVKVQVGYEVEAGDVIFEAEVANFDSAMATLRGTYDSTETSLEAVLDKDIRLKRTDEAWAAAYEGLETAKDAYLEKSLAFKARAVIENVTLAGDALPDGASEALAGMYGEMTAAQGTLAAAQSDMDAAERYTISDDVRAYITDKIKYERQLAETEEEMLGLTVLNERVKSVVAQEDGYITKLNAKAGESFNPASAAYAICPKDEDISLRADTTDVELSITKGMSAYLTGKDGDQLELKVTAVGVTLTGGTYAEVELGNSDIKGMGGVYALASADSMPMKIEYKAKQATTLLPAAAVRGSGTDRYVYTLQSQQSSFGTTKTVTVKTAVTVLAESNGTVSVSEDLSWMQVAYMEDRSISEGDAVMAYSD
jgi:multidrug efflux pump subunit AcrA (membrane-fusion protein)